MMTPERLAELILTGAQAFAADPAGASIADTLDGLVNALACAEQPKSSWGLKNSTKEERQFMNRVKYLVFEAITK